MATERESIAGVARESASLYLNFLRAEFHTVVNLVATGRFHVCVVLVCM